MNRRVRYCFALVVFLSIVNMPVAWAQSHAGTYDDPKTWRETTFVGAIHHGDRGYFAARFEGVAHGDWYFPARGTSDTHWEWGGGHAGTFTDPKDWDEPTRVKRVHAAPGHGFFRARFDGTAQPGWPVPGPGESDDHWEWGGSHAGTYRDPKTRRETTYTGAVHHGDNGFFRAEFDGVAAVGWYYPKPGASDSHWTWLGAHAGTFEDPKLVEPTYVGASHRDNAGGRFVSKRDGVPPPDATYPDYANNEDENAWWRTYAVGCNATGMGAPPSRPIFNADKNYVALVIEALRKNGKPVDDFVFEPLTLSDHFSGYQVGHATIRDHLGYYVGDVIVAFDAEGRYVGLVDAWKLTSLVVNDGTEHVYAGAPETWSKVADTLQMSGVASTSTGDWSADCNGNYVVDLAIAFTQQGDEEVRLPVALAAAQIERINLPLHNSRINLRARLVDVPMSIECLGVNTEDLSRAPGLFQGDLDRSGADILAVFTGSCGRPNTASGYATIGGSSSIQKALSPNAFRHEFGHNLGGHHCSGGSYANGTKMLHNGVKYGTIQCDNDLPFYSTPLVKDSAGTPFGDATHDVARAAREGAQSHSAIRKATTPVHGSIMP